MRDFAALYRALDQTTATGEKIAALAAYFASAPPQDRVWTLALFTGRRPRRAITATKLRLWAAEAADLPLWLFEEAYALAGDLAETIALVLPPPTRSDTRPLADWIAEIRRLGPLPEEAQKAAVLAAWDALQGEERFLFNKLLTGGFRVGVAQGLVVKALARATGQPEPALTHRLMGDWQPDRLTWDALLAADAAEDLSRPYPFALAHQLPDAAALIPADWQAEPKWDGIRAQLILRGGQRFLWSRGEELVTERYPELATLTDWLPDGTVLDGELLVWGDGGPRPFSALQPRIGRKAPSRKLLAEAPVVLMAYDLLEDAGQDLRALPMTVRRARLERLMAQLSPGLPLHLSPAHRDTDLAALREQVVAEGAEGLMLKRLDGPYPAGRKTGLWWKWKRDPFSIDAVMVYAQAGHGRRADLFTDYTFAVRDGAALVPVAKAYSGLTDAEFAQVSVWVRANTLDRFGPVRQVRPELVFELAFEGIAASPRHKSGIALRFPRMARWRQDKPATEIDTLDTLRALLPAKA